MSNKVVFTIFVPDGAELLSPDLMNMGLYAIFKGTESYSVAGGTEFRFDKDGIDKISTEQLAAILQFGVIGVKGSGMIGPRYLEMTDEEYNGLVPVSFPESGKKEKSYTYEDVIITPEDGEPYTERVETEHITEAQQMTFAEYAPFGAVRSVDGKTWIFDISERADGDTCGDGTSWEEFQVWFVTFGLGLMTSGQYMAKLATPAYTQE